MRQLDSDQAGLIVDKSDMKESDVVRGVFIQCGHAVVQLSWDILD